MRKRKIKRNERERKKRSKTKGMKNGRKEGSRRWMNWERRKDKPKKNGGGEE